MYAHAHARALAGSALLIGLGLSAMAPALAGQAYAGVGLPGLLVGYAHTVNSQLGLRADAGGSGSFRRDGRESGIDYQGTARYNRLALLADYHPFGGGFRLTGGVTLNDARLRLKSQFDGVATVTLNGQTITPSAGDYLNAEVRFPKLTPYLGLGWGHQERPAGLGFVADLGVSVGTAKLKTDTNIVGKTYSNGAGSYTVTQADVDSKTQDLRDNVGKVKLLPHLAVGLSYRY